jgi:hypothetical protein
VKYRKHFFCGDSRCKSLSSSSITYKRKYNAEGSSFSG